jgi:thiol:disulfide interchange protein DsbA
MACVSAENQADDRRTDVRFRFATGLMAAMTISAMGLLQAGSYEEGTDYFKLGGAEASGAGAGVEVIEFFSYGCGHCATLEPHLNKWLDDGKPENATLRRIPVAWSQGFEALARVYYTAEILGVPHEAHEGFFNLIHVDRAQLSLPMIAEFFAAHGADTNEFIETFGSPQVTERVNASKALARKYQISAVPSFVVDGAYKVPSSPGGFPRMLETVNYVVESVIGKEAG